MKTQSPEYLRVQEEITRKLCEFNSRTAWTDKSWEDYKRWSRRFYNLKLQFADSILAIKGIAIIADDQNLPTIHETGDYKIDLDRLHQEYVSDNFKKVVE